MLSDVSGDVGNLLAETEQKQILNKLLSYFVGVVLLQIKMKVHYACIFPGLK